MVEFEKCVPRQSFQKCLFLLWTPKIFSWQDGDDAKLLILSPTFKVRFGPLSLWSAENENETTILNQKLFSFSPLLLALVLYFTPFLIFKSLSFNLNLSLSFTLILPIHFVCLFHFLTSLIHSQIRDDVGICMLSLCVFLFYYIFFSILLYPTVMHDFCSPWIQKSEFRTMWWTIGFNWVGTFQQKMVFLSHTKSKHFKLLRSKEIWNILCNSCLVVSHFLNGPSMPLFP